MTKDQILVMTAGEGAVFEVVCCMRALEDFDTKTQIRSFKKLRASDDDAPDAEQQIFLAWAMEKRLIKRTVRRDGLQWWLGVNGELFDLLD